MDRGVAIGQKECCTYGSPVALDSKGRGPERQRDREERQTREQGQSARAEEGTYGSPVPLFAL